MNNSKNMKIFYLKILMTLFTLISIIYIIFFFIRSLISRKRLNQITTIFRIIFSIIQDSYLKYI